MRLIGVLIYTGVLISLVLGCESRRANLQTAPEIFAVARVNGKGVPNGRSDTSDGYIPLFRIATDVSYGFAADNPVKLGGPFRLGSNREQSYLNALRGPAGEPIEYERIGSCCPFETSKAVAGMGFLDAFWVTYEGQAAPLTIYLNVYDDGLPMVPAGLTPRQLGQ